ncbi:MAG TPA: C25 family cysteine peptidase [Thermoanaerobaculia bacterium]|nr:C25 family cysteine peptidase [Thermoanaerobaculia bacterium]
MVRRSLLVLAGGILCLAVAVGARAQSCNQVTPPTLCIDPLSWNVIGLDSNKAIPPNSDGPDTFMVGARACNKGATTLTNVTATYNTVGAVNAFINLADNSTLTVDEIRPGRCEDFYFNGQITRVNAAYFTSQGYTVTATSGALSAVTPSNRALYIEQLNSQNRNSVTGVTGPTSLQVGGIYTFNVLWSTAPGGYEQLEHFVGLANTSFRLLSSYSTYDTPVGGSNTSIYADACGWDNNTLSPTYQSCIGPTGYPGGKTGGNVNTFFTVQILGATPVAGSRLRALIYDFSGSSYHYNTDYNNNGTGLVVNAAAAADLRVTISDSPDPVTPGGSLTYTGTVTNAGLSPVTTTDGGALKIPVPPNTTFNSINMPGWTCGLASGVVTCTPNATFAKNATASYTMNVTVDPTAPDGSVIYATASIESSFEDPSPSNNTASTTTTVVQATQVDLSVTNTVPAAVVQGSTFAFTQTVTNLGPATAANPTFSLEVPAGATFNSVTTPSPGWTCVGPTSGFVTCTRATPLAVGEQAVFSLNLTASGAAGTNLSSQASAGTTSSEPYTINNYATTSTNIVAANSADVAITVSDFPDPVVPGESILYTQTVTNNGVVPASNVTVTFPTPPNTTYSYLDQPVGWTCSTNPLPGTPTPGSAGTITCTKATLAVGETASFPLTVSVNSATAVGTTINYAATVSSTTADSVSSNNTSSASTLVGSATAADVQIVKTPSVNPARTSTTLVYTLLAQNNGPATATNVSVSDPLPTNLTFVSVNTSKGTCSYNSGTRTISCAVGTLSNGQVAAITVRTTVDAGASGLTLNNTATTTATQTDPRLANNSSTAPVTIFAATAASMYSSQAVQKDNTVELRWNTSFERDNLGFNIYREAGASGRVKLNRSIVVGSTFVVGAEAPAGFSYKWTDRRPVPGAVYWIESIDLNGTKKLHGPLVPGASSARFEKASSMDVQSGDSLTFSDLRAPAPDRALLQRPVAIEAAAQGGVSDVTLARQFDIAGQPAAKILIGREGYYRITRADLIAAGFDPGSNPKSPSLYVDGQEMAVAVNDGGDGKWDPADSLEFYAVGMDTTYSGTRAYWLVAGNNGLRFKPKAKVKGAPLGAQSFPFTVEKKDRFIFFGAQAGAADRDSYYGPAIFWEPTVQTLDVANLASSGNAVLTVVVQGATFTNHRISVVLNGASLGYLEFASQSVGTATFNLPLSAIRSGSNEVVLTGAADSLDISFLDYIDLTYPHTYAADANALRFPATGSREATVSGFSGPDIRVIDVTDPYQPTEVDSSVVSAGGSYSLVAIPHEQGPRTLFATTISSAAPPVSISANRPSSISSRSNSADFVIISHSRFINALAPLVSQRKAQGLETVVVDVEDVFDEYGYGSKSPDAIRDFLRSTLTRWKKAPRFVMLVGDASVDPHNYEGYGDLDLVPTRLRPTVYMKAASDDWMTDFDGDGVPDMYLGRLPVHTEDEARELVSKIVSYSPPASRKVLLVVDQNDPTFSFSAAAAAVKNAIPRTYAVNDFKITSGGDRPALVSALNGSPSIVNYVGHGSIEGWSNTAVLMSSDTAAMVDSGSTPLYVMMTCLNALFADVFAPSLGESLLGVRNGGAIAVWASTGMSDPPPQNAANLALFRALAANPSITIGELVAQAKKGTPDRDVRTTWVLLGDPTIKLQR